MRLKILFVLTAAWLTWIAAVSPSISLAKGLQNVAAMAPAPAKPDAPAAPLAQPAAPEDIKTIRYSELIDLVGKSRGKVVVLNFWATWCGPCREEIPELRELRKSYGEDKLVLVGVSLDTGMAPVKAFMTKYPFNYPVYLGAKDVITGYSVMAIPRTVIYDTKGEKAASHEGYMDRERLSKAVKILLEEK